MDPLIGLGLLLLVLVAMYFFVRGWEGMRAQFGTQLQDLFGAVRPESGPQRTAKPTRWPAKTPRPRGPTKPTRPHQAARGTVGWHHAPTSRHH
jgi:hypothetical protein